MSPIQFHCPSIHEVPTSPFLLPLHHIHMPLVQRRHMVERKKEYFLEPSCLILSKFLHPFPNTRRRQLKVKKHYYPNLTECLFLSLFSTLVKNRHKLIVYSPPLVVLPSYKFNFIRSCSNLCGRMASDLYYRPDELILL